MLPVFVITYAAERTNDVDAQWHYKDEKSGKRLGPVGRDEILRLIADDRIERASLVWTPAMPEWARASTTELNSLFGDQPPPMPAGAVTRWAVYTLALVPLLGVGVQLAASAYLSDRVQLSPLAMFDHRAWGLLYLVANAIFGSIDARALRAAGYKISGAAFMAAFVPPVYIFASCRRVARHAGRGGWLAYLPFVLWFAAFAGSFYLNMSAEDLLA